MKCSRNLKIHSFKQEVKDGISQNLALSRIILLPLVLDGGGGGGWRGGVVYKSYLLFSSSLYPVVQEDHL